ncbi:hypothetical protein Glove_259g4 [Diversispora epigaea]|uniref:Uncharacterized protein n=1 Tax=Diversispora epigaea TaxID=1348612 RepID=A0A397IE27_9GLOM|nr:hypothetical protein Glove_259g4 [Diversispora epigaea]
MSHKIFQDLRMFHYDTLIWALYAITGYWNTRMLGNTGTLGNCNTGKLGTGMLECWTTLNAEILEHWNFRQHWITGQLER